MLSQLKRLSLKTDGRYATDAELQFVDDYVKSFSLRVQTYEKLQISETTIVQQLQDKLRSMDPTLLQTGGDDLSGKWKRDTIRILRYSAIALLLDDPFSLQERLLFWMQTIMRAYGAQRSCDATYTVLQDIVQQHLTPPQADLLCPILELNRRSLGTTT